MPQEKKKRTVIPVNSAKDAPKPTKKAAPKKDSSVQNKPEAAEKRDPIPVEKQPKGKAGSLRIAAVILWIVGILFEVAAILLLNSTIYIPGNATTYMLIALGIDLVAVIIASQLWKKANHIDPASEKNKVKFFLWNNMGVIASIIAFLPILILFLSNKDLDKKTKKLCSIVAGVALLLAVGTSVDYNPVSQEDVEAANADALAATETGTVYWTTFGRKYHYDLDCQHIINSDPVYSGDVEDAVAAGRTELCKTCATRHADALPATDDLLPAVEDLLPAAEDAPEELDDAA